MADTETRPRRLQFFSRRDGDVETETTTLSRSKQILGLSMKLDPQKADNVTN